MKVRILIGLPGSGKSTWAAKHCQGWKVFSADNYFMVDGKYKFDASKLGEAHDTCLASFTLAIMRAFQAPVNIDKDLVVDNTNLSWLEMAPYVSLALAFGYDVELVMFDVDEFICLARNIHGVPEAAIKKMAEKMKLIHDGATPIMWRSRVIASFAVDY